MSFVDIERGRNDKRGNGWLLPSFEPRQDPWPGIPRPVRAIPSGPGRESHTVEQRGTNSVEVFVHPGCVLQTQRSRGNVAMPARAPIGRKSPYSSKMTRSRSWSSWPDPSFVYASLVERPVNAISRRRNSGLGRFGCTLRWGHSAFCAVVAPRGERREPAGAELRLTR